ncbi:MAG: tRNA (guanosine(46)-N7)-methyltransferase TrmB, partial [Nitratireductor sp.]|nr:tRNA (guanosine(46)-N7)-methyltransferase TrmB [Nitratireductor sp.]
MSEGEKPAGKTSSRPPRAAEAFFGRRKAKPLRQSQQALYDSLLPALRLDISAPPPPDLADLFTHRPGAIRLEIGFGGGEHLAHEAERFPQAGFIGAEVFVNGVARMLQHIEARRLSNVRIHDEDALRLLDWLPDSSLDRIDLLYPDPWPKKRHWKRRFVSKANLDRFARVLKPGGEFRFASDIPGYVEWTLEHCAGHPAFGAPLAGKPASEPWEGWLRTRYEAKAIREGRSPAYLSF